MARLREHQRHAMPAVKMDNLVDIGGFNVMRGSRQSLNVRNRNIAIFFDGIDAFAVAATQDMGHKIKRMVMGIAPIRCFKLVERSFKRKPVYMVFVKGSG